MRGDSPWADLQNIPDTLVGHAFGDQPRDRQLARAEAGLAPRWWLAAYQIIGYSIDRRFEDHFIDHLGRTPQHAQHCKRGISIDVFHQAAQQRFRRRNNILSPSLRNSHLLRWRVRHGLLLDKVTIFAILTNVWRPTDERGSRTSDQPGVVAASR